MTDRLPRTESDPALADVKAKPCGWPTASLDPGSGRGPTTRSGSRPTQIHNFKVSTVSGDCQSRPKSTDS